MALETFKKIIAAIGAILGALLGRSAQAKAITDREDGAMQQAGADSRTAAKVAGAEAQAVADVPADNDGLAKIADKGKW